MTPLTFSNLARYIQWYYLSVYLCGCSTIEAPDAQRERLAFISIFSTLLFRHHLRKLSSQTGAMPLQRATEIDDAAKIIPIMIADFGGMRSGYALRPSSCFSACSD